MRVKRILSANKIKLIASGKRERIVKSLSTDLKKKSITKHDSSVIVNIHPSLSLIHKLQWWPRMTVSITII